MSEEYDPLGFFDKMFAAQKRDDEARKSNAELAKKRRESLFKPLRDALRKLFSEREVVIRRPGIPDMKITIGLSDELEKQVAPLRDGSAFISDERVAVYLTCDSKPLTAEVHSKKDSAGMLADSLIIIAFPDGKKWTEDSWEKAYEHIVRHLLSLNHD